MTRIWREAGFVDDDPWIMAAEDFPDPAGSSLVRSVRTFLDFVEKSAESDFRHGVLVEPADEIGQLAPHLDRIELIAVAFPAFNDGRAFSHAALLRTRYGYGGEIRAVGDILIDQIPLMLRCGIDSFAVSDETALKRLAAGRLTGIQLHYQPSARPALEAPAFAWRRSSAA